AVYPTKLFEASLALIGLIPIIRIYLFRKKRIQKGVCFLLYAVWFSAMRLAVLPLRSFPYEAVITHVFYPALYLTVIAAGSLLLWKKTRSVI
ncbi:MAG TPA: hypothetical protein PLU43_12385, partial [Lachnospiraceae bacterium]|nr:hypothetical protein [Lachnospiraceae bacterium]